MRPRLTLPNRRNQITQKVRAPSRTLYISIHDDPAPAELFLRVKGQGCTAETIALYDVIARLASLTLQYVVPIEEVGEMLLGSKFEPAGPFQGHPRIKNCNSLCDLIGRHLLVEYCGREELAHVPVVGRQTKRRNHAQAQTRTDPEARTVYQRVYGGLKCNTGRDSGGI